MFIGRKHGFTLIELLIVVAIIGILSAIAVTNVRNALVKAKVVSTKSNLKSIITGIEMYKLDHNAFPGSRDFRYSDCDHYRFVVNSGYVQEIAFKDEFELRRGDTENIPYLDVREGCYQLYRIAKPDSQNIQRSYPSNDFNIYSIGPDHAYSSYQYGTYIHKKHPTDTRNPYDYFYQPSNGISSKGDIVAANYMNLFN